MQIKDLNIGVLFSFSEKGAVHMVSQKYLYHIEYKSYSDGKIRVVYTKRIKPVFIREEWSKIYEAKWFHHKNL